MKLKFKLLTHSFKQFSSLLLLSVLFSVLSSCGSSDSNRYSNNNLNQNNSINKTQETPPPNLTLYVHGFSKDGYKKTGVFGASYQDPDIQKFLDLGSIQTADSDTGIHLFKATSYYGDTPPLYYSEQDNEELHAITTQWDGGIPRYAMIVAKYAKQIMQEENVDQINIVSGSMGSLVTRWMIEKNVENLASNKKIAKWYSLEGVITGNYAAGKRKIIKNFYSDIKSIDIKHMSPQWINKNLHSPADEADNPYYKNILLGQQASTDDNLNNEALTQFLFLNGQFSANDGTQRVQETRFTTTTERAQFNNQPPTFTLIHKNHLNLTEHTGAWAGVLTFLNAKKRVRITLLDARVDNLHEKIRWYNRKAEIIFGSKVYSPQTETIWGITEAISERTREGATLPVHKYKRRGQQKELNQIILNQFVPANETELRIQLTAEEIDYGPKYGVYETRRHHYGLINQASFNVPVEDGTYAFDSHDWSFRLNVKVVEYYVH